ncbi:odorant receptor 131-2-like [Lepisosteus oculatus]|uniref:odorant receptor 131-2-like n=1 Tax=Lepisosteus oculatus TaxID=7918 RepID=UPI0035F51D36
MLIFTYFHHPIFYENSRYVLFVHLVINDVFELSVSMTMHIWNVVKSFMLVPVCYAMFILASNTTLNTPLNLALMSLERYIAICYPLRHSQICSLQRTYIAIGLIWIVGIIPSITDLFIVLAVEQLSFFSTSVYCIRESFYRTSYQTKIKTAIMSVYLTVVWLVIVCTYLRIMFAARSASSSEKTSAKKARNTILLHGLQLLLAMLTYIPPFTDLFLVGIPREMFLDLDFVRYYLVYIVPRVLSPVIYGLREENFRKHLKSHMPCFQKRVTTMIKL